MNIKQGKAGELCETVVPMKGKVLQIHAHQRGEKRRVGGGESERRG